MNIDKEKYKKLIIFISSTMKEADTEMLALQFVFHGLKQTLGIGEELDFLLAKAKESPALQKHIREKYDVPLETLLKQFDQIPDGDDQDLMAQLLAAWQSKGPIQ